MSAGLKSFVAQFCAKRQAAHEDGHDNLQVNIIHDVYSNQKVDDISGYAQHGIV